MKKDSALVGKNRELKVLEGNPLNCEAILPNLRTDLTEDRAFYIRNHFPSPDITLSKWSLAMEFDGSKKRSFNYEEVSRMPQRALAITLECAGNGRKGFQKTIEGEIGWGDGAVGTALWSGVSLATLINESGLSLHDLNRVTEFIFVGADGSKSTSVPLESKNKYSRSLSTEKGMNEDTIVAIKMNGRPLTKDHGFPARLIVPGWYAMASVKWLDKIILSTKANKFQGHFNSVKYVYETRDRGKIIKEPITNLKVKSLIITPEDGDTIEFGEPIIIEGKAWSGFGEISKVEVDFGEGWDGAELLIGNGLGQYAWKSWRKEWVPHKKGTIKLSVRAIDEKGNSQPDVPEMNRYLYGYNAIQQIKVIIE